MAVEMVQAAFDEMADALKRFSTTDSFQKVDIAATIIARAIVGGNRVFSCGNGGSMCDAMHFAEELSGKFRRNRPALPAIAISDPSYLSCVANDFGYQAVFSRYLEAFGKEGDILLTLSTSGNSQNVLEAAKAAQKLGIFVISLTGNDGGRLALQTDLEIRVPHNGYADRIQEIHIKIIHTLIQLIEYKIFGDLNLYNPTSIPKTLQHS
ncbi:MAG: D-sedoheptulose 7-phosphate isomerase [Bacteroidia bacterium]|nr:D-sedoheptulose 7-phosphate isomerase [Bacteroidia bacterium]